MVPSIGIEPMTFPMSNEGEKFLIKFVVEKLSVFLAYFQYCQNIANWG